jgi:hypothetical protein
MTKSRTFRVKSKKRELVMFQSLLVLIGISLIGLPSQPSHYIRDISLNLAQFIDCSYRFMPAPSFWKF